MSAFAAAAGMPFPLHHNLADETAYSMMHVPVGWRGPFGRSVEGEATARGGDGGAGGNGPPFAPTPLPPPSAARTPAPTPAVHTSSATEQRLLDIVEQLMARLTPQSPDALQAEVRSRPLAPQPHAATLAAATRYSSSAPSPLPAETGPLVAAAPAVATAPSPSPAAQPGWLVPLLVAFGVMNVLLLGTVLGLILIRQGAKPAGRARVRSSRARQGAARAARAESPSWLQQVASEVK